MNIEEQKRSFIVTNCFHVEHAIKKVLSENYKDKKFKEIYFDGTFYCYKHYDFYLMAVRASNDTYVVIEC